MNGPPKMSAVVNKGVGPTARHRVKFNCSDMQTDKLTTSFAVQVVKRRAAFVQC